MEPLNLQEPLESALRSPQPRLALQKVMAALLEKGHERDEIEAALAVFRSWLAERGRADEDELILELMDGFEGWCRRPE